MTHPNDQNSTTNYICIRQLLDKGEKHLHRIFLERWSIYHNMDYNISEWKNAESSGYALISFCTSISKAQKEILKLGKLDDWDISLTFSAIQGISKEIRNYGGILDVKEDKIILDLKNERNKHAHGKFELSDEEFSNDWERLSNIMIEFGEDLSEIEEIKNKNLRRIKENKAKTECAKLKRKANKFLKQEKYCQAIDICDKILRIPDLSAANKATILSKRTEAFLKLETEDANEKRPETELDDKLEKSEAREKQFVLPQNNSITFKAKLEKAEIMPNQIRQVFSNQPVISLKVHVFEKVNTNDYGNLVEYYTKAANNGFPEGMFYLAILHESGKGTECNEQETFRWLHKAATAKHGKGIVEAQYSLGLRYYAGSGVERDLQKAAEWFEKAAKNGCEASANNLGVLYKFGEGVEQSMKKAFYYFKLAAENGDITGMQNLAHCYFTTQGTKIRELTEENMIEGVKWMKSAGNIGEMTAKNHQPCFLDEVNLLAETEIILHKTKQHFKDIQFAAINGSQTVQKVLRIWEYMDYAKSAFEKHNPADLVAALSKAIRLDYEIVHIPKHFKAIIKERIKTHGDDINCIVCFVHINIKSCDFPIYVVRYLNRYRFDEYLFEMLICCFMQIGELEAGLNFAENGLKTWPHSLRFKYCYAIALCKQDNPCPKVILALDEFLASAPPDHEKIPSCYYRKAAYYMAMKNDAKFIESYEAAHDSEKRQLPCFST